LLLHTFNNNRKEHEEQLTTSRTDHYRVVYRSCEAPQRANRKSTRLMDSGTLVVSPPSPDYLWTLWGGIAARGSLYVEICHGNGFSYRNKSQRVAFSFTILDTD